MPNTAPGPEAERKKLEGNLKKKIPRSARISIEAGIRVVYNRATGGEKWGKVGN
jgi:hypothetical protein